MTASDPINPQLQGMGVSPTFALNQKCAELQKQGKAVYNLGLGESPFPIPKEVVRSLAQNAAQNRDLPVKGLQALREAVADFHRKKDLLSVQADDVVIGPGTKELLFLLQLAFDGKIILSSPYWVSYESQARILGNKFQVLHTSFTDQWLISPESLAEACKTTARSKSRSLLILNYPGNPSGTTYTEGQLREIAAVARKHNLIILSDEIYGQIHHQGKHISVARFYPEGTIVCSGLSKWCAAGGWRLGTFVFPPQLSALRNAMATVASETFSSVSSPIQHAAITAFKGGEDLETYLKHVRRIFSALGSESAKKLSATGCQVHIPQGGFYHFIDFSPFAKKLEKRGIRTSTELCEKLLQDTGVAILPGAVFGRAKEELTARLAYVDFDGGKALEESYKIPLSKELPSGFTKKFCTKVVVAVDLIVEWLRK